MARVSKDPDMRRSELLASAQRLFFTKGYDKTSINDIVKDVGVAKGLFYYYFDSKQMLLGELADEVSGQAMAVMHAVVMDDSLNALEKWARAFAVTASWKTARKDELIAIMSALYDPSNVLLNFTFRERQLARIAPEIAKIIEQGVTEGVFDTPYPLVSAEISISMMSSISDAMSQMLLNPTEHPNSLAVARQKIDAIQTAVERMLGASPGSLPLLDDATLERWYA